MQINLDKSDEVFISLASYMQMNWHQAKAFGQILMQRKPLQKFKLHKKVAVFYWMEKGLPYILTLGKLADRKAYWSILVNNVRRKCLEGTEMIAQKDNCGGQWCTLMKHKQVQYMYK